MFKICGEALLPLAVPGRGRILSTKMKTYYVCLQNIWKKGTSTFFKLSIIICAQKTSFNKGMLPPLWNTAWRALHNYHVCLAPPGWAKAGMTLPFSTRCFFVFYVVMCCVHKVAFPISKAVFMFRLLFISFDVFMIL